VDEEPMIASKSLLKDHMTRKTMLFVLIPMLSHSATTINTLIFLKKGLYAKHPLLQVSSWQNSLLVDKKV